RKAAPDGAGGLKAGRARAEQTLRPGAVAAWPRDTTRPACPIALVREDAPPVDKWRSAARTTRRVADRLGQAAADVGIVHTEEDGVRLAAHRQVRDKGIVSVKNQLRVGIERCEGVADPLGECVELEIAIHLVAKKI